jgi:hypothetical protein
MLFSLRGLWKREALKSLNNLLNRRQISCPQRVKRSKFVTGPVLTEYVGVRC